MGGRHRGGVGGAVVKRYQKVVKTRVGYLGGCWLLDDGWEVGAGGPTKAGYVSGSATGGACGTWMHMGGTVGGCEADGGWAEGGVWRLLVGWLLVDGSILL